jgi:hypothetical protein
MNGAIPPETMEDKIAAQRSRKRFLVEMGEKPESKRTEGCSGERGLVKDGTESWIKYYVKNVEKMVFEVDGRCISQRT